MLEEKLLQASKASHKDRKRMFLMLFAMALCSVIFIGIVSVVDFNAPPPSSKASSSKKAVTVAITPPEKDPSALRTQFMQQLRMYEEETEPALADANLQKWAVDKAAAISSLKKEATASFAAADYASALKKLSDSETLAQQILVQRNTIFSSQLALAGKALANDNAIESKLRITKALLVNPNNQQALALAKQIDALPQIIALLKKATIAQTENNPEKEYAAIAEAYKLDPNRQALKQRADMLVKKIRESRFSPLIARGLANVEKRRIKAARSNYRQAKAIYPERSELRVLNKAIAKLADGLNLEGSIAQGKAAIARDDWVKAQSTYSVAAKRHPDDKTILDGLQLSNRIVSLQSALAAYIRHPGRLSSPNISSAAQDLLIQAKVFSHSSAALSRQVSELNGLIANMNKKIPVTVKSDNQTFILVRGVGKVGITQQRTIQLKPGIYTFEGIRKGYISKLIEVRIPVGTRSFGVEVVCDERI